MSDALKTHKSGVVIAQESDTIESILDQMALLNLGSIVVARDGKPVGIFTERDLLRKWRSLLTPAVLSAPISSVMSSPVLTLKLADVDQATELMYQRRIRHIPVVDDSQRLIGIISARDILASAVKAAKSLKPALPKASAAGRATNILHLVSPEATLVSACQSLLPVGWTTAVHSGVSHLLALRQQQGGGKADGQSAYFIDIDGLQPTEWKALLRQLVGQLTQENQPDVFLVWSPGRVADKDLESLRTISKSAKWRAYERPISLGQFIEDLRALAK